MLSGAPGGASSKYTLCGMAPNSNSIVPPTARVTVAGVNWLAGVAWTVADVMMGSGDGIGLVLFVSLSAPQATSSTVAASAAASVELRMRNLQSDERLTAANAQWRRRVPVQIEELAGQEAAYRRMTNESPGASRPDLPPDCDQVRRLVWLYLDDELASHGVSKIHTHLRECASCRRVVCFERAFLRTMRAALRARLGEPSM